MSISPSPRDQKLGDRARQKRNESISATRRDSAPTSTISIATTRGSVSQPPYLPLTLHFSPRASSASATERGIPTATSALLVRRLKTGNAPARDPGTEKRVFKLGAHSQITYGGCVTALTHSSFKRRIDRPLKIASQSAPLSVYVFWMAFHDTYLR